MYRIQKKSSYFPLILLGLWTLLRSSFYEYYRFEAYFNLFDAANKLVTIFIVLYCISVINNRYDKLCTFIVYGFLMTFIGNLIIWQSNFVQELSGFVEILGFFSFFFLLKQNIPIEKIEKFLLFFAVLYFLLWLIAIYNIPRLIFGQNLSGDLANVDRGFFRLWIPDKEHFPILLFFSLGQFLLRKRYLYAVMAFFFLLIIILHVGRQMIMWSLISSTIMIFMLLKKHKIQLLIGVIVIYILAQWILQNVEGVSIMLDMTQKQTSNADQDIRTLAIKHFIFDFPHNPVAILFGNGIPCENTELRQFFNSAFRKGYFIEDVGFVGMYVKYGLWMVIIMLTLLVKCFCIKVESRYLYLKFYILYVYGMYLFGHALTTDIFYVMIAYYIIVKSNYKIKQNKHENKNCICFNQFK